MRPLVKGLYFAVFRRSVIRQVREAPDDCWPLAERVFSAPSAIYSGLIGPTARLTIQAEIMKILCEAPEQAERWFFENVTSADPVVAGYCLDGLDWLNSDRLRGLPRELFDRTEKVVLQTGCSRLEMTLGELATIKCDKHKRAHKNDPSLAPQATTTTNARHFVGGRRKYPRTRPLTMFWVRACGTSFSIEYLLLIPLF